VAQFAGVSEVSALPLRFDKEWLQSGSDLLCEQHRSLWHPQ